MLFFFFVTMITIQIQVEQLLVAVVIIEDVNLLDRGTTIAMGNHLSAPSGGTRSGGGNGGRGVCAANREHLNNFQPVSYRASLFYAPDDDDWINDKTRTTTKTFQSATEFLALSDYKMCQKKGVTGSDDYKFASNYKQ